MRITGLALLSIAAASLLAACASVPLKTVYNLWSFDPWTSDFRIWRAAVRLPDGRGMSLDAARVQMKIEASATGAPPMVETFVLERSRDPADLSPLLVERRAGFALAAFRFAPADYPRLETVRARILAAKKSGAHQKGAISISAASCGGVAAAPGGAVLLSTFLMVEPKDGYNPLVVDYDIAPELRKAAAKGEPSAICAAGK